MQNGLFQKKSKQVGGGLSTYFFEYQPETSWLVTLPLETLDKTNAGNSRKLQDQKTGTLEIPLDFFLITLLEIPRLF